MAPVACRLQMLTGPFVKSFVFAWSEIGRWYTPVDTNVAERDPAPSGICTWILCCVCVCLLYSCFQETSFAESLGVNRSQ